jgi:sarcosine oxidase, subunit beta
MKMWSKTPLKDRYDVVIIGGGVHGLSIAYYLAKCGITNVAILDKTYIGGGNSGRNTEIVRANYRNKESVVFYYEALTLYKSLAQELNYNIMHDEIGHITLAFSDTVLDVLKLRVETNTALGVDSRLIGRDEVKKLVPLIRLDGSRYSVEGALYHPPGGTVRHDALVWGLAHAANGMGVEIHPHTEVTAIRTEDQHVTGVSADGGEIRCNYVINATAGWCSTVSKMVGIRLPVVTVPLQACVSEPLKPFMNSIVTGSDFDVYFFQSDRGELVTGAEIDPYSSYSQKATLPGLELIMTYTIELLPALANVNVMRQWAGICDMTPDFSPIIGEAPELKGFIQDVGWGTYGFKTAPAAGKEVAELIATGKTPDMIRPFSITRFYESQLLDEKAAGVCLRPYRESYYLL